MCDKEKVWISSCRQLYFDGIEDLIVWHSAWVCQYFLDPLWLSLFLTVEEQKYKITTKPPSSHIPYSTRPKDPFIFSFSSSISVFLSGVTSALKPTLYHFKGLANRKEREDGEGRASESERESDFDLTVKPEIQRQYKAHNQSPLLRFHKQTEFEEWMARKPTLYPKKTNYLWFYQSQTLKRQLTLVRVLVDFCGFG